MNSSSWILLWLCLGVQSFNNLDGACKEQAKSHLRFLEGLKLQGSRLRKKRGECACDSSAQPGAAPSGTFRKKKGNI
ncbi:MAG: hypothetical protein D3906_13035 [Candidatus Electrothrix sp. AUS1_2]|nr:hypothetical protein [Candidatus Electrothrix sp. AUS1_2]